MSAAVLRLIRVSICDRCLAGMIGPCRTRSCSFADVMLSLDQQRLVDRLAAADPVARRGKTTSV